jgi:hypothetical protein
MPVPRWMERERERERTGEGEGRREKTLMSSIQAM